MPADGTLSRKYKLVPTDKKTAKLINAFVSNFIKSKE